MPILDMPIEQLRCYQGVNPRPDDFDEYWAKALAELEKSPPEPELIAADFAAPKVECFDLYFNGVRGARLHARYVRPRDAAAPHPAVVMFHGYGGNNGDWSEKLCAAAFGFSVASLDCRGQSGLSSDGSVYKRKIQGGLLTRGMADGPENLYFRHTFLDTVQFARVMMAMPEVDPSRVGATGGSQGGALTLVCAALEPRIKRAAAVYPFLCDYKRVWDMDLDCDAYADICAWFREYDPLHEHEQEFFKNMGYVDVQHLAPRIRGEVLVVTGLRDNICPPSTQFAAYNKIIAPKRMDVYPEYKHEFIRGSSDRVLRFLGGL